MQQPVIWVERRGESGRLLPARELALPVADRGFGFGDGLFETMRLVQGRIPLLERHLVRLAEGLAFLGFPPEGLNPLDLTPRVQQYLHACGQHDGYLKLTVSRGIGPRGYEPPPDADWLLVIEAGPWSPPAYQRTGMHCGIAPWRVDPANPTLRVKSLNGLEKVLARREASRRALHEMLFLNTHGHLTEGAATNLFVRTGGVWKTPALSCGLLPGVARAVVLERMAAAGERVIETEIALPELLAADEAFLTNALMGVAPVGLVEAGTRRTYPVPGPGTERVNALYQ